ncbi:MAG: AzlD family protein [Mesorhizobium sp.]|nr:MAG: AzlD family protein [Mesorhizobium sp.]
MIDATTFFTIVLMAGVTYLTRIGGYVVLRNRTLSGRATAVMEAAPGCVLIAVIAPAFVSKSPADILALAVTLVAATRLSMLIGVASAGLLRHFIG